MITVALFRSGNKRQTKRNRQIIVKSPDSFKVSCVVEGVATQQQQLDQVPRDVAAWFIRVIRVIVVIR